MAPGAHDERRAARDAVSRWRELSRNAGSPGRNVLVAASFTANPIVPGLGCRLHDHDPDHGVAAVDVADYNQLFQVCLQPVQTGAAAADDVVVLWRIEDVFERDFHDWADQAPAALDRLLDGARSLGTAVARLADSIDGAVVASDAPVPVGFGLDHRDPWWLHELVELQRAANQAFDEGLADAERPASIDRLRLGALQLAHGSITSFDRRNWAMYRQPLTDRFAYEVGAGIADVIASRTRVPPKVLVLDADNTLWGGTLVDDGVGGLQCSDAFPGFAHRSFQLAARRLRHRGVLLAVASKNDPDEFTDAFERVDGMVLTLDDLAGRRVSWDPKPQAIAELADEFHLGLDSFVFVDDSDYELGAVRTQLPGVGTLRVPDDIEELPDLLAESGWFRLLRVTADDRDRTDRMIAEAGRSRASVAMSHDEFLAALDLRVRVAEPGPAELTRVAQLVNKTNQFNLTTVRRGEPEIADLVRSDAARVFAFAVDDRFGEYGTVGVVIAVAAAVDGTPGWELDTVLMSCRVLGRGVETAMLAATVHHLRAERPGPLRGRYVPTDRNAMVADLLAEHGFEAVGGAFVLPADRPVAAPAHVTVVAS